MIQCEGTGGPRMHPGRSLGGGGGGDGGGGGGGGGGGRGRHRVLHVTMSLHMNDRV